jgi:prevent-host-death family protein
MNVSVSKVQNNLTEALNRVINEQERVVLQRRGKDVAAIVSIEDLKLLQKLEDRADLRAVRRELARMKATGEKPVPWEQVKKELGL